MKIKNIKLIIKTLVFTTIISTSCIMAFASEGKMSMDYFYNKYEIVNNGKIDNTPVFYIKNELHCDKCNVIIDYSNGSKYVCDVTNDKYTFKPLESDKEIIFNNIDDLNICKGIYTYIKETTESQLLRSSYFGMGVNIDNHSNIIYVDNLKTDENLIEYAKCWLKNNYNMTLDIPIYYSNINEGYNDIRKESKGGEFNYKNDFKKTPISIKIESEYTKIDIFAEKALVHELTHYALNKMGKDFSDNTKEFEKECIKNGGKTNDGKHGKFTSHLKCTL